RGGRGRRCTFIGCLVEERRDLLGVELLLLGLGLLALPLFLALLLVLGLLALLLEALLLLDLLLLLCLPLLLGLALLLLEQLVELLLLVRCRGGGDGRWWWGGGRHLLLGLLRGRWRLGCRRGRRRRGSGDGRGFWRLLLGRLLLLRALLGLGLELLGLARTLAQAREVARVDEIDGDGLQLGQAQLPLRLDGEERPRQNRCVQKDGGRQSAAHCPYLSRDLRSPPSR